MEKLTEATLHLEKVTEATLQFRIPKSNLSLNYSQKFFWLDWTTVASVTFSKCSVASVTFSKCSVASVDFCLAKST